MNKLRLFIFISAFLISLASCDNAFFGDKDVGGRAEDEIAYASAQSLDVTYRVSDSQAGTIEGKSSVKLSFPFVVLFNLNPNYGTFSGWKVYQNYGQKDQALLVENTDYKIGKEKYTGDSIITEFIVMKKFSKVCVVAECQKTLAASFVIGVENPIEGYTESDTTTARLNVPVAISFTENKNYGTFVRWHVFKDYSYDPQTKTATMTEIADDDNSIVSFVDSDFSSISAQVAFKQARDDIAIFPEIKPEPFVWFISPSVKKESESFQVGQVVPAGKIDKNAKETFTINASVEEDYAITGIRVYVPYLNSKKIVSNVKAYASDGEDLTKIVFPDVEITDETPAFIFTNVQYDEFQLTASLDVKINSADVDGYCIEPVIKERPVVSDSTVLNSDGTVKQKQSFVLTFSENLDETSKSIAGKLSFRKRLSDEAKSVECSSMFSAPVVKDNTVTVDAEQSFPLGTEIVIFVDGSVRTVSGSTLGNGKKFLYSVTTKNIPPSIYLVEKDDVVAGGTFATCDENLVPQLDPSGSFTVTIGSDKAVSKFVVVERCMKLSGSMAVRYEDESSDSFYFVPENGKMMFVNDEFITGKFFKYNYYSCRTVNGGSSGTSSPEFYQETDGKYKLKIKTDVKKGGFHQWDIYAFDKTDSKSIPVTVCGKIKRNVVDVNSVSIENITATGCNVVASGNSSSFFGLKKKQDVFVRVTNVNSGVQEIRFFPGGNDRTLMNFSNKKGSRGFEIDGLKRNTSYSLGVQTVNEYGYISDVQSSFFITAKADVGDIVFYNPNDGERKVLFMTVEEYNKTRQNSISFKSFADIYKPLGVVYCRDNDIISIVGNSICAANDVLFKFKHLVHSEESILNFVADGIEILEDRNNLIELRKIIHENIENNPDDYPDFVLRIDNGINFFEQMLTFDSAFGQIDKLGLQFYLPDSFDEIYLSGETLHVSDDRTINGRPDVLEAVKKAFDALDWNYRVDHIYTRFNRSKHSYGQKYESYTFVNGDIGFVCPVTELVGIELY